MIKPRDYQAETIEALFKWWADRSPQLYPLLSLPTGAGKTIIFSLLLMRLFEMQPSLRVLVMAHRKELISQAADKLRSVWPEAPIGIFAAGLKSKEIAPITIASRGTLKNALDYCGTFDLIIIDEAHNISTKQESEYQQIFEVLKQRKPNLSIVGFTATPYRMDSGPIYGKGQLFAGLAHEVKIKYLIDNGYLCRLTAQPVDQSGVIKTDGVRSSKGDFVVSQLDKAARDQALVVSAVQEWTKSAASRRFTLFFCVSVAHAEMVSDELQKRGFNVPVLHAKTKNRDELIELATNGELDGIANVGVLTEGTDIPITDCVAMLRPTRSLGLYLQMVGRGLRLYKGKKNCLLLDFGGCMDRFGPIDIAQPPSKKRAGEDPRTKVCENESCGAIVGIHKRKCPECDYIFLPMPVKQCPNCDEENSPSASECIACGHVFVTHEAFASSGAAMSDDHALQQMAVSSISAKLIAGPTGGGYIMLTYHDYNFNYCVKNLYIGATGLAGIKAIDDWKEAAIHSCPVPRSLNEAMRFINSNQLKIPSAVIFDPADQSRQVKQVIF